MRLPLPNRILAFLFLIVFCAFSTVDASATVRRVPAGYPTLRQAIRATASGAPVLVAPGTHTDLRSPLMRLADLYARTNLQQEAVRTGYRDQRP